MALVRWSSRTWDPFGELSTPQERVNRLFEETSPSTRKEEDPNLGAFYPAVDINEGDKAITLKADLPGIKKEDVHIDVNDGVITLRGERKFEKEDKRENYHRIERSYGSFHRSFTLPSTVDAEKIKAKYKDGILEVTLPKTEEAKPKSIPVEVN
ncbi:MAG: Hsp20 family protein [Deltaproteobacteria bacterium]|nr:Hsp20 family protein [Deltaproteobacteria bacterium]